MYKILKKYMNENYSLPYLEADKQFSFYLSYANTGTYVQHLVSAGKNSFSCHALLPFEMLYDGEYFPHQVEALLKINNNIGYGSLTVNEETKQLILLTEYAPDIEFSEFTEHIFIANISKMIYYGMDVFDAEYGELLTEIFGT